MCHRTSFDWQMACMRGRAHNSFLLLTRSCFMCVRVCCWALHLPMLCTWSSFEDLQVTSLTWQPALGSLGPVPVPVLAQTPLIRFFFLGGGRRILSRRLCQKLSMLWLCSPVTRPPWSGGLEEGGFYRLLRCIIDFHYCLFAHCRVAAFSNSRSP